MAIIQVLQAKTSADILACRDVMSALRSQLNDENIVPIITGMMDRGYHLIYIKENGKAVCASGYRFTEHLAWGKAIYIDDLSTLPTARRQGYARILLDFICEQARAHNCREVHLDSGCVPARYAAHRLYLRYGFNITSHHFALKL
jgi:GNAT superfamily N-acetyltransferase